MQIKRKYKATQSGLKYAGILTICTLTCFFLYYKAAAQTFDNLDTNNIDTRLNASGDLFWDYVTQNPKFEVPKGNGIHSIFAGNMWIGGLDTSGQLHIAANRYRTSGNTDFWAGPIATNYNAAYDTIYNRVWKINKTVIDTHIVNYADTGYVVPASIADWPANGNIANGEAADLAPYIDVNLDNIYNPDSGDYPQIRGDQSIYFIFNDDRDIHSETGGNKLGVEIHGLAYSYNIPLDTAVYNTVFLNYTVYNRSGNNYSDVYVGSWIDFDIGNFTDDYVGCDTILNAFFAYNGDSLDQAPGGYGASPPAQGAVFLSTPLSSFVYYNNDTSVTGSPSVAIHYYNYLRGIWKDGSKMLYGGNGHFSGCAPPFSCLATNYMFPADPSDTTEWSEVTAGNIPADRRGLGTSGPFTLVAGQNICVDMAFPFARDSAGSNITNVSLLKQRIQEMQTFYNSQGFQCDSITGIAPVAAFIASDTMVCEGSTVLFTDLSTGTPTGWNWNFPGGVPVNSNAQYPPAITYNTPGAYSITLIAINANGSDSIVTTLIVSPTYSISDPTVATCNGDSISIYGTFRSVAGTYYDSLTTINGCDSVHSIVLTVNPIYSIGTPDETICGGDSVLIFGIYRTTAGTYYDSLTTVNSCDSIRTTTLTVYPLPTVDLGADTMICNGCSIILDAGTGLASYNWSTGENTQTITVDSAGTYIVQGNDANGCTGGDTIVVDIVSGVGELSNDENINIYPNPNTGVFNIEINLQKNTMLSIKLYQMTGQQVFAEAINNITGFYSRQIDMSKHAKGLYYVQIVTDSGVLTRKVVYQ